MLAARDQFRFNHIPGNHVRPDSAKHTQLNDFGRAVETSRRGRRETRIRRLLIM